MPSLTSTAEKSLAVGAIVIAISGYGAEIAHTVVQNDTSESAKLAAKSSLNKRLLQLISDLFSDQASVRKVATSEVIQGWKSDTLLVKHLLKFAGSRQSNSNGIYNSVVVPNAVDIQPLLQYKDSIQQFLDKAKERGPKTKSLTVQVRARL